MTDPTTQPSLNRLIARLASLISAATDTLEADPSQIDAWYDEVARQLRRYTLAAWLNGSRATGTPDAVTQKRIADMVKAQLDYLSSFRDEIKGADQWSNAWKPRAQMYAESIKNPWWSGRTRGYPLPAMPGDGTTICLTHCGCGWEINDLEGDGNADAYWRRHKEDSCQTCVERESQWSPLRIRGGELQSTTQG